MPLKEGRKSLGENIAELMRVYKEKGKIGNVKPKDKAKAKQVASAIAYRKAREG
jgi:hypothetical protein